jgi:hypothetical protein
MGRQFSYYAFPEDLAEIEREVFKKFGGSLLVAKKRNTGDHVEVADSFPLALDRMGTENLSMLLAPPVPLQEIVFANAWLDVHSSHLIEVGRSYIKDGRIREARFWYEPTPLVEGQFIGKPVEFLDWASQIYRHTKKLMVRHSYLKNKYEYTDWCGKIAKQELVAGRVKPF